MKIKVFPFQNLNYNKFICGKQKSFAAAASSTAGPENTVGHGGAGRSRSAGKRLKHWQSQLWPVIAAGQKPQPDLL